MSDEKQGTLNWLQRHLPEGLLADTSWLEQHGFYSALRARYLSSGWLERVGHSAYRRPPGKLSANEDSALRWQHAVISLQTVLGQAIHVGGRTALELEGFAHYLTPQGPREIHLYGDKRPRAWVFKLDLPQAFIFHGVRRLFGREGGKRNPAQEGLKELNWGHWNWPMIISTPERAILELLDEVPRDETFHQADMIMEGLRTLSPRKMNALLTSCHSVKVKRLFLWLAERHNHAWLKHIKRDAIDLGKGKRQLCAGGRLDPTYLITVPEGLDAS